MSSRYDIGDWSYRKVYTLLYLIYNKENENFPVPQIENKKICMQLADSSNSWVLLGLKLRGFAKGIWNGFGGKVQDDDTSVKSAALREMKEESGLDLTESDVFEAGRMWYICDDENECMEVHVFICPNWRPILLKSGELEWPSRSDEMYCQWFPFRRLVFNETSKFDHVTVNLTNLPLDNMWADDDVWLKYALSGNYVIGFVHFSGKEAQDETTQNYYHDDTNLFVSSSPYKMKSYGFEIHNPAVTDENKKTTDPNFFHELIEKMNLKEDDDIRKWMKNFNNYQRHSRFKPCKTLIHP